MSSKSLRRMVLSFLILACVALRIEHGREKPLTAPMDEYERTMRALNQYRALASEDDGTTLPAIEETVEPGEHYADASSLAHLLSRVGDLPPDAVPDEPEVYQGALVEAVGGFNPVMVWSRTAASTQRCRSVEHAAPGPRPPVELARERWRRRPYDPARPAIVLNLPEFDCAGGQVPPGPIPNSK